MPPTSPRTEANAARFSLNLSEDEVLRLLEDKSSDVLVELTDKIGGAYTQAAMEQHDNIAAEQIFRLLLRDTELRVRVTLAEHVKNSNTIPRDIVVSMARDVEEVALPILQHSEVLNDHDLLELLNNTQEITRYLAISKRERVSPVVSDSLLEKGDDTVAAALVNNAGALISPDGLEKIVEQYSGNQSLMNAVSNRPHLPVALAEKLITVVSSSLAATLKDKYKLADIEQEAEKARESETLHLIRTSRAPEEIQKLINQLHSFERLTPSMILGALCQGNFVFFETSLAKLAGIPTSNARTLINDRGELGFRAIYSKSGLPDSMFPAVSLLLKVVHELDAEGRKSTAARYANTIVERLVQYSETLQIDNLSYIIALVRKGTQ